MPVIKRVDEKDSEILESCVVKSTFDKILGEELGVQIEFQLPETYRKWNATDYISIKRNIYVTKRRIEDDGIFCSCSPSSGSSSVCSGECHCEMLFSTCSSSCKCGELCNNKPFQQRVVKKLKVVKTEKCGLGLVADEDIRKGDFVIEYVGEVIDDESCEERLWKMKHRGDTNFYLCEVNHGMVIDATFKGNKSRFINHSCAPNTEMQKWRTDGETRIVIFAIKNIKKGKELTYDYQFVQFGADQDCHCGALNCRKKLGSKPSKTIISSSDDNRFDMLNEGSFLVNPRLNVHERMDGYLGNCIGKVVRLWCSHSRGYFGGIITNFDNQSREHTILFEDGHIECVNMSKEDWDFL
ncbi:histone-lysine N-methyltransferase ASHH3-like [Wolffia australiana]